MGWHRIPSGLIMHFRGPTTVYPQSPPPKSKAALERMTVDDLQKAFLVVFPQAGEAPADKATLVRVLTSRVPSEEKE